MPGWETLDSYSRVATLALGLLAALGLTGLAMPVARRADVAAWFRLPVAWLGGVLLLSLATQLLALLHAVNGVTMATIGIVLLLSAVVTLHAIVRARPVVAWPHGWTARLLLGLLIGLALLHLAVAITPPTRSDEIAYHILIPARIWSEGGLVFHRLPYEATVFAQFGWQIAQTLFQALGQGAASAVLAVSGTFVLAGMGFALVRHAGGSVAVGLCAAIALLASGYSIVFMTTVGPHAFQYLATSVAVLAALYGDRAIGAGRPIGYALTMGIACAAMIAAKLPMAPLAMLVTLAALFWLYRAGIGIGRTIGSGALIAAIIVLAVGPMALWSLIVSGSPGGVTTLTGLANPAIYDPETLAVYRAGLRLFVAQSSFKLTYEATYWNVAVIAGTLLYVFVERSVPRRVIGGAILLLQVLLILFVLPTEIRHLGGVQYGLFIACAVAAVERAGDPVWAGRIARLRRPEPVLAGGTIVLLAPWIAVMGWFGLAFLPVATGLQTPRAFVTRYTPFSAALARLDAALPRDAVLLVAHPPAGDDQTLGWLSRPAFYYAPRPVAYHSAELPPGRPYVLLLRPTGTTEALRDGDLWVPGGTRLGATILHDPAACFYPQRVPRGGCGLADLTVIALRR